jgi:hypothetical protein
MVGRTGPGGNYSEIPNSSPGRTAGGVPADRTLTKFEAFENKMGETGTLVQMKLFMRMDNHRVIFHRSSVEAVTPITGFFPGGLIYGSG